MPPASCGRPGFTEGSSRRGREPTTLRGSEGLGIFLVFLVSQQALLMDWVCTVGNPKKPDIIYTSISQNGSRLETHRVSAVFIRMPWG